MANLEEFTVRLPLTKDSTREEVEAVFATATDLSELEGVFEGEMPAWIEDEYPGIHRS